jgi:hypothetical protein
MDSMSEFGCNINRPRKFIEMGDLYSSKMTPVYSGGIVYEYVQAENNYGVVNVKGNTVEELPEFATLRDAFKNNPAPSNDGGYKPNGAPSECPPPNTKSWQVKNNTVPAMPDKAVTYLEKGAGPGPGLKKDDKGSQWAGTATGSWETPGDSGQNPSKTKKAAAVSNGVPALGFVVLGALVQCFFL